MSNGILRFHRSGVDILFRGVVRPTVAVDGFLVVDEVPPVPELFVHLLLKKKMRRGHVLYVFEVGHGLLGLL